jgi:DNA ligase (NAD+)
VSKDAMDIRSFGEANVRKFFELGLFSDIPGIYEFDSNALPEHRCFGEKSITNLRKAIEESKVSLHRLIYALKSAMLNETTAKTHH